MLQETVATSREQRKVVTALFCDVTESTALGEQLDPEALRELLGRYFEEMKAIVERHGGSVEKFIGDAVMAVFGVPLLHEDDALRACRAAMEMRDALPALGIGGRIGVNTGEVVAGTEERLATGDAVNVAARLEQAAEQGEVLIGESTLALVRSAVVAEPTGPLRLKGKGEPVSAHRLLAVEEDLAPRFASPMVGRERELQELRQTFARALHDRSCQLFTVLGSAGIGKSRLAAEFLTQLEAPVVQGHCLSYGEGISYWPVVEIVQQIETLPEGDAARPLRSLLGEIDEPSSPDEIAWGFRKLLEQEAREQPLVVVLDDLHWGEGVLLDLVEHVAELSRDAPILLLCLARPELLELRPSWGGGKWNATTLLLEPLDAAETGRLLANLGRVPDELRARILQVAEGNPLFLEEMLALVQESEGRQVEVPPTIRALLAARLDQLPAGERAVLERGSVEGRTFHRGTVTALLDEPDAVDARLIALVRKELVRPDRAQLPHEDAYRFRHVLIRDAAYEALPKAVRTELHERFAARLEEHGAELSELDEIVGYHLEQAIRYKRELGREVDDATARRAHRRLADAGRRAEERGDYAGEVGLLERAAALVPAGERDNALEIELIEALWHAGRGEESRARAVAAAVRAAEAGDRIGELCARIEEGYVRTWLDPEGVADEVERLARSALPEFEAAGDDLALFVAYRALGQVANMRCLFDGARDADERAAVHARRAGLAYKLFDARATYHVAGTAPVQEALAWLDAQEARHGAHIHLSLHRAGPLAMLGRIDEARAILETTSGVLADRGDRIGLAGLQGLHRSVVELTGGDVDEAVDAGLDACRILEELGERSLFSTVAGYLARALCAARRFEEAEQWAARARELAASDDALTQHLWRQAQATVLADRGEYAEAERVAREAVAIAEATDALNSQGDALFDLAHVLEAAGRHGDASAALQDALARYERKGNLVMAERVRSRLTELHAATSRR